MTHAFDHGTIAEGAEGVPTMVIGGSVTVAGGGATKGGGVAGAGPSSCAAGEAARAPPLFREARSATIPPPMTSSGRTIGAIAKISFRSACQVERWGLRSFRQE